jgi:hypothetical protein
MSATHNPLHTSSPFVLWQCSTLMLNHHETVLVLAGHVLQPPQPVALLGSLISPSNFEHVISNLS